MSEPRKLGYNCRAMLVDVRQNIDAAAEEAKSIRRAIVSGKDLDALASLAAQIAALSDARADVLRLMAGDIRKQERGNGGAE